VRIGLLHPGEMGAAVGATLEACGHELLWDPRGRSEATRRRAEQAGLIASADVRTADIIISVCPPSAALEVAASVSGTPALVIDANAVSPSTATEIGRVINGRSVDGAIVGPPPRTPGTTRIYLSGSHADEASRLFAGTLLEPIVLDGNPAAASALKMAYAAWTKGSAALLLATMQTARAYGLEAALRAEWELSQPTLAERLERAQESARAKGWRWVGEMLEIAATFADAEQPAGFHQAAAEVFERFPRSDP
jgi:3-hydroxyisobutyrate dehydrogenase-like beta-hydroxyacid dehydrogenase